MALTKSERTQALMQKQMLELMLSTAMMPCFPVVLSTFLTGGEHSLRQKEEDITLSIYILGFNSSKSMEIVCSVTLI